MTEGIRSNIDVVVYALARLGGGKRKVATEDIAHESFHLAPSRFSWVLGEYKQFPDKQVVRLALEDAAKAQYGALVEGRYTRDGSKDGWVLTPAGIRWLAHNQERVKAALYADGADEIQLSPTEVRRLRARLRREPAFDLYTRTGSLDGVSRFMFTDMLQCSPDAPRDLLRFKFDRLLSQAQLAQDSELVAFLHQCSLRFADLLGKQEEGSDGQEPQAL